MNNIRRHTVCLTLLFYLCSLFSLAVYLYCNFDSDISLSPIIHVLFLCIICVPLYAAGMIRSKTDNTRDPSRVMRKTFIYILLIYTFSVLMLTLFDGYMGRAGFSQLAQWKNVNFDKVSQHFNFIPFRTLAIYVAALFNKTVSLPYIVINLLGNAVVFMPFALLLPAVFSRLDRFWNFFVSMLCLVGSIEILQLILLTGTCDIDDLMLNVAGACAAYGVLHIKPIKKIISKALPSCINK